MASVIKTSTGVVVQKPWYLSKKNLLCALALGLALYQSLTGKWEGLTPEQLAAKVAETATWLGPILTLILSIAHVDGKTRGGAILADVIKSLTELDDAPGDGSEGSTSRPT